MGKLFIEYIIYFTIHTFIPPFRINILMKHVLWLDTPKIPSIRIPRMLSEELGLKGGEVIMFRRNKGEIYIQILNRRGDGDDYRIEQDNPEKRMV